MYFSLETDSRSHMRWRQIDHKAPACCTHVYTSLQADSLGEELELNERRVSSESRRCARPDYASVAGTGAPAPISSLDRISLPVLAIFSVTVSKGGSEGP